ncbi:hypothetical protein ACWGI8_42745 [Streptomyces sp. NPDC054841]
MPHRQEEDRFLPYRRFHPRSRGAARRHALVRDNGSMSLFRADGIVLRTQKLGEADRIMLCFSGGAAPHCGSAAGPAPRPDTRGGVR